MPGPMSGGSVASAALLFSSTVVDLNEGTEAKQPLYTCPVGRRAIVTQVSMQKFSANPTTAVVNLGWNAAADNLLRDDLNIPLTNLNVDTASAGIYSGGVFEPRAIGNAGDVLGLIVDTPEGSALTARVDVFGYLTDTNGVPV